MEEKLVQRSGTRGSGDYQERFEECLAQLRQLRGSIERDQEEIDRLKAETRAILAELKAA